MRARLNSLPLFWRVFGTNAAVRGLLRLLEPPQRHAAGRQLKSDLQTLERR